ncbi:putative transporter C5D6.04 [Ceratocystis fimbriata CBS 114723]|uniref:Putative transporter C5D6.04 n=1 Tax=Ceratocystis fimbriata CBS 114723 TaxID=1035309 RepID=A0A2C5WQN7_9PEZI|nr:putative transporter C5D6.04 [Ceratocystis fimbriata CBS 114723]
MVLGFSSALVSRFVLVPLNLAEASGSHESHPDFMHLVVLVMSAVLEVVCVSLPGYIIARMGHFDAEQQKFLANLNMMLFTPCLIFTKLASQLNADKLIDLSIIPIIFCIMTFVSWTTSRIVAKVFGFNNRASNFVTAMGVFGNSNSLPISLILSLSQTLKGLHWDRIPGDNDDEVGARGILYLLIFQQLGQIVRWSWGYHVLLAPKSKYPEYQNEFLEEGRTSGAPTEIGYSNSTDDLSSYDPPGRTPIASSSRASRASPEHSDDEDDLDSTHFAVYKRSNDSQRPLLAPDDEISPRPSFDGHAIDFRSYSYQQQQQQSNLLSRAGQFLTAPLSYFYNSMPLIIQSALSSLKGVLIRFLAGVWDFMNPPLWAMLFAIIVASVPSLQKIFFEEGSFVNNSVSSAIKSTGGVAVPLILVILGANLARNTQNTTNVDPEEEEFGGKLLVACLISRMVLPTVVMAPILAMIAKFVPISILDDPIFIIVCFLLTGAPSALQLAQICQINNVYEGVMSKVLFQSYVVWILPSTLVLVMCALEVVEWASMS